MSPTSTPKKDEVLENLDLTQHYITQRLTEHFGYLPLSFIDDVINAVNDLLYKGVDIVDNYTQEALGEEAEEGMQKLITLLESAVDKNFDKFELYALKNIFNIPVGREIALQHERITPLCGVDEAALDLQLKEKREALLAAKRENSSLRRELRRAERYLDEFDTISSLIDVANDSHEGDPVLWSQKVVENMQRLLGKDFKQGVAQLKQFQARKQILQQQQQQKALQAEGPMGGLAKTGDDELERQRFFEETRKTVAEKHGVMLSDKVDIGQILRNVSEVGDCADWLDRFQQEALASST